MVGARLLSISLTFIGICLSATGCLTPATDLSTTSGSNMMGNMTGSTSCPTCPRGMPAGSYSQQAMDGNGNGIRQAGYQQPMDDPNNPSMNGMRMNGNGMNGPGSMPPGMGRPGMVGPGGPGMVGPDGAPRPYPPYPHELAPVSHQSYRVAPPDILFIDTLRMIPRDYRIGALDVLLISATNTLPNQEIKGPYTVGPDGKVALGFGYGNIHVGGMSLEQAAEAIKRVLERKLALPPEVSVSLAQFRTVQQVRAEHLVRPDGTISLGTYGSVYVAGMTLGQIKAVIEKHLSNYLIDPQVSVDVFAYNSQVYYVIFDGAGYGMQVIRLPITGNETVLDAVSRVNGLAAVASKRRMWLARPSPSNLGTNQIMPIDWNAITMAGSTATNYQVFPGDRIYVDSNWLIALSNRMSQVLNPINQLMGSMFLGIETSLGFQSLRAGSGFTGVGVIR